MSKDREKKDEKIDGAAIAASIINAMSPSNRKKIVAAIEATSPDTANKLNEKLYSLDKILTLSTLDIQLLSSHISMRDLIISLKLASDEIKNHILQAFTTRKQKEILAEFSILPPMRKKDVMAAIKRIIDKIYELESTSLISSKKTKTIMSKIV